MYLQLTMRVKGTRSCGRVLGEHKKVSFLWQEWHKNSSFLKRLFGCKLSWLVWGEPWVGICFLDSGSKRQRSCKAGDSYWAKMKTGRTIWRSIEKKSMHTRTRLPVLFFQENMALSQRGKHTKEFVSEFMIYGTSIVANLYSEDNPEVWTIHLISWQTDRQTERQTDRERGLGTANLWCCVILCGG